MAECYDEMGLDFIGISGTFLLQGNLLETVIATVLPVAVVRLTGDALHSRRGLLSRSANRGNNHCDNEREE